MRAAAFEKPGDASVIQLMDLPIPEIEDDEVLIEVKACALNHLDIWVRQGLRPDIPMPHIGGCETAGVVSKLGSRVKGLEVGQRILISPGQADPSGVECGNNLDSLARDYHIQGYQTQGGLAEYTKTKAYNCIPISEAWSFEEWAAIPLTFVTAWNMLHHRAQLRAGEDVLVIGASSGVGVAATQIAKHAGARVLAVAGSDEKLAKAKELGADLLINYNNVDIGDEARKLTGKRGVDVVFEHVGQAVWKSAMKAMARGARLVTCGATTGPKVEIDLRFFFSQQLSVSGAYMGSRAELHECLKLVDRKVFRPVVDSVFPLEKAREAQEKMERREMFGKIVVTP